MLLERATLPFVAKLKLPPKPLSGSQCRRLQAQGFTAQLACRREPGKTLWPPTGLPEPGRPLDAALSLALGRTPDA